MMPTICAEQASVPPPSHHRAQVRADKRYYVKENS